MSATGVGTRMLAVLGDPRRGGLPASALDDAVTALASLWLVTGLALGSWAHAAVPEPGSLFAAWHLVFDSGFAALAGWTLALVWRRARGGARGFAAVPVGYRSTVVAVAGFTLSAVVDVVWHAAFEGEGGIGILFSPGHLGLALSMLVLVTSPVRSAMGRADVGEAPPLRLLWPALLTMGLAAALVMVMVGYGNAITYSAVRIVEALSRPEDGAARELAAALVLTAAVLLLPLLFLARRWRLPFGAAALTMLPVVAVSGAETGGDNVSVLVAFAIAAVGVDLLILCLDPFAARPGAYWGFSCAAAFFTWSLYIGIASAAAGQVPSAVELWVGVPIMAGLLGWLLGILMLPTRHPVPPVVP
ncbi:hypothetical protein NDR87_01260 [Nocardia sp. CDC159]|uniref:Uncharacterized protein n=1 Tax=Nocardia pulmonis TaxID=2951408 RepID=A0A9X2IWY7_9NOCA|nr:MULTISPECIES: hypothetical protein [Nocardia]MCM6772361.1 hypothetical protein [Nocardia pulmonis]MCM6784981.1 hypothetical protein [Nocardia sp. CDC159]